VYCYTGPLLFSCRFFNRLIPPYPLQVKSCQRVFIFNQKWRKIEQVAVHILDALYETIVIELSICAYCPSAPGSLSFLFIVVLLIQYIMQGAETKVPIGNLEKVRKQGKPN